MSRFTFTFLITLLFLVISSSPVIFAQEGYPEGSPEAVSTDKDKVIGTDEYPKFPSINEFTAQQTYIKPTFEVIGVETSLGHDTRPAFQVIVPNQEPDDVAKEWEKFMKKYGADVDETEATIDAKGARISDIASKSMNVYTKIQQKVEGTGVVAIFETDKEEYIGDDLQMNKGIEMLMSNFAMNFAKEDAQERLKNVEKSLKDLENLMDKLQRQNEGYHKDIVKAKGDIAEAKGTIDMTKQQKELTENIIDAHQESEAYLEDDVAAKELKKQNKELKKLEKTKEKSYKNIDKEEQTIIEAKENIEENERQQKMVQEAIINQRQEVRNAQQYLKVFE
ncbi:MAG: hypothetical protein R3E32_18495 [Chitinophagales bacterium]